MSGVKASSGGIDWIRLAAVAGIAVVATLIAAVVVGFVGASDEPTTPATTVAPETTTTTEAPRMPRGLGASELESLTCTGSGGERFALFATAPNLAWVQTLLKQAWGYGRATVVIPESLCEVDPAQSQWEEQHVVIGVYDSEMDACGSQEELFESLRPGGDEGPDPEHWVVGRYGHGSDEGSEICAERFDGGTNEGSGGEGAGTGGDDGGQDGGDGSGGGLYSTTSTSAPRVNDAFDETSGDDETSSTPDKSGSDRSSTSEPSGEDNE